jgi:hypothetical protein
MVALMVKSAAVVLAAVSVFAFAGGAVAARAHVSASQHPFLVHVNANGATPMNCGGWEWYSHQAFAGAAPPRVAIRTASVRP